MLRNVSELMLASVSHYEILEGERFGPKFAPIRTAVCLFFFVCGGGGGVGGVLVNTAQLICLFVQGLLQKQSQIGIKNVLKRLEMDENWLKNVILSCA